MRCRRGWRNLEDALFVLAGFSPVSPPHTGFEMKSTSALLTIDITPGEGARNAAVVKFAA